MEETKQPKTFDDLYKAIRAILPYAQFETDNYGQIIIQTDLTENQDGILKDFDPVEDDN